SVPWLLDPGMQVDGWLASLDSLLTPAFSIQKLVPGHGVLSDRAIDGIQFTNHYLLDARKKATQVASWGTSLNSVREWGYLGAYDRRLCPRGARRPRGAEDHSGLSPRPPAPGREADRRPLHLPRGRELSRRGTHPRDRPVAMGPHGRAGLPRSREHGRAARGR